jgi:protease I
MGRLKGKKILIIIAHKVFRDEEYQIPRDIFEKEGAIIKVASTSLTPAMGKNGLKVYPDILLQNAKSAEFDAVVFVGGAGCKEYWHDITAQSLSVDFYKTGKLTTAICSAPVILAYAGLLKGRKATCFSADKEHLLTNGAHYLDEDVVEDGRIITANGYLASGKFAETIVKELQ